MYSKKDKNYAFELYQSGYSVPDIVSETGISRATVYRIIENKDIYECKLGQRSQNVDEYTDPDYGYEDSVESDGTLDHSLSHQSNHSQSFENEKMLEDNISGLEYETTNDMKNQNIEVEKLRLKLEHEREMEKLRQMRKAQELEERRLKRESELLARKEQEYQDRILEEEEEEERINRQLLIKVKRIFKNLEVGDEDKVFTNIDLQNKLQIFMDIQSEVEDRAVELNEDHEDWLVWQCLDMTYANLKDAVTRIDESLFNNSTTLRMDEEEIDQIRKLLKAPFLNLFFEHDED